MSILRFETLAHEGAARRGRLTLRAATFETPTFMPVGTQATVKALEPWEVESTGARIILANTYHLWIRPGPELIAARGGVKAWMRWPHALLTDSGGYQVFSLAAMRDIDDDGVTFRSHLDGSRKRLTPELAMQVQAALGSDIAMVLDECPPGGAGRDHVARAIARTTQWARRCIEVPRPDYQARFGIVQGAIHEDLRLAHLQELATLPFEGLALGGFSVGEPLEDTYRVLQAVAPQMPADKPRYLMGVGTPYDLLHAVGCGIDLFDCVLPTRNARNGQVFSWHGRVNLRQARHREDDGPIDPECGCPVCERYSRSYLRHLIHVGEMLGPRLLTLHNLHFYASLMKRARQAIGEADYRRWAQEAVRRMREGDEVGAQKA